MKITKGEIAVFAIALAAFIVGACFYPYLPERMASHWNARGEVDGYMSKAWGAFLMPIVILGLGLLFMVTVRIDPLKANITKFRKYYDGFIILFAVFLFCLNLLMLLWNIEYKFSLNIVMPIGIGLLVFYLGILCENAKRNWFIGIRTPWTLSSDSVWDKTHRIGGNLFKAVGIVILSGVFWPGYLCWFILIPTILVSIFLVVYSYVVYQKVGEIDESTDRVNNDSGNGTWETVKAGYVEQVEKALASAGHREKKQVLEDVQSHLDQRFSELASDEQTWENMQTIITEMGPASDYAELLESVTPASKEKRLSTSVIIIVTVIALAIIFAPYVLKKWEIARAPVDVETFRDNFDEKLEKLDIDSADLRDVISTFGKPASYVWGHEQFDPDNLPERYIVNYSDDFSICFSEGKIVELRHEGPDFKFMGKINVGTPLAEVLDVFGMPDETVEGGKNRFQDNVLYMDIEGRKGHCYYGRTDKNARLWFLNYEVIAIYTTRSDYGEDGVGKSPKILKKIKRSVIEKLSTGNNDGDAADTAERWLRLVDEGNYGESWEAAAEVFKNAATKEQWASMAKTVRQPLGKVISRQVMSKMPTQTVPGGPDGEYVIVQFKTSFENKADAIETVTPMLDKDGAWRVSGYYIK